MISLIICSIDPRKFAAVKAMYAAAFGDTPWELLGIHDARSAADGYNRGFDKSRGDIVIFSHDDVEIISPDFPQRLSGHLAKYDIVGVAGSSLAVSAVWYDAGPPYLLGQMIYPQASGALGVNIYGAASRVASAQAVDGVFIAARRSVFDRVKFDAVTFDGFQCWDQDFCRCACLAGLKIGVACDINLIHDSQRKSGEKSRLHVNRFNAKWPAWVEEMAPRRRPRFAWTLVIVPNRAECLSVMTPTYW
jgi:GT2 family glycosyltransferase